VLFEPFCPVDTVLFIAFYCSIVLLIVSVSTNKYINDREERRGPRHRYKWIPSQWCWAVDGVIGVFREHATVVTSASRPTTHRRCRVLKKWLIRHRDAPYPTGLDKRLLAQRSNMTVIQVISATDTIRYDQKFLACAEQLTDNSYRTGTQIVGRTFNQTVTEP